jgi:DNA-binding NarL/FixJ family response regulator
MKRVLLIEDHNAFRESLASFLDRQPDLEVVAQADSLAQLGNIHLLISAQTSKALILAALCNRG